MSEPDESVPASGRSRFRRALLSTKALATYALALLTAGVTALKNWDYIEAKFLTSDQITHATEATLPLPEATSLVPAPVAPTSEEASPTTPPPAPEFPVDAIAQRDIRERSPSELKAYLRQLPPLQAKELADRAYLGRSVRWTGKVFDVAALDSGFFVQVTDHNEEGLASTFVRLDDSWRPVLEGLRRGDTVKYEGTLERIDSGAIIVTGTRLQRVSP